MKRMISMKKIRKWLHCLIMSTQITFLVTLLSYPVNAAEFNISSGDVNALIEAINMANSNDEDDTINLEAGTYTLTEINNSTSGANGLPPITSNITINGAGSNVTIIERDKNAPDFRIFFVRGASEVTFKLIRVTVSNGFASGSDFDEKDGGGICFYDNGGSLFIKNSVISNNTAEGWGGGIYFYDNGGSLFIKNSVISNNTAEKGGGGISGGEVYLQITDSIVSNNNATRGGGIEGRGSITGSIISNNTADFGGGLHTLYEWGSFIITDCKISYNTANEQGGGIYIAFDAGTTLTNTVVDKNSANGDGGGIYTEDDTSLSITTSTISENTAGKSGGGIYRARTSLGVFYIIKSNIIGNTAINDGGGIFHDSAILRSLRIENSTIAYNQALNGGGLFISTLDADKLHIVNSTISNNMAITYGGGLYMKAVLYGIFKITNSTVSDNRSNINGGGIFYGGSSAVELINTIVANNTSDNCFGIITSLGFNLEDANTCGLTKTTDLINTNPLLGPLQDNGGPTHTHALLHTSPAIDGGDNTTCPADDQRGKTRPIDGDHNDTAVCDIGAYELQSDEIITLDYFLSYKVRPTKGTPRFEPISTVALADQFEHRDFVVSKPKRLYNPVDKNGGGINDPDAHLVSYSIKLFRKSCLDIPEVPEDKRLRACQREEDCGGTSRETRYCKYLLKSKKQNNLARFC